MTHSHDAFTYDLTCRCDKTALVLHHTTVNIRAAAHHTGASRLQNIACVQDLVCPTTRLDMAVCITSCVTNIVCLQHRVCPTSGVGCKCTWEQGTCRSTLAAAAKVLQGCKCCGIPQVIPQVNRHTDAPRSKSISIPTSSCKVASAAAYRCTCPAAYRCTKIQVDKHVIQVANRAIKKLA